MRQESEDEVVVMGASGAKRNEQASLRAAFKILIGTLCMVAAIAAPVRAQYVAIPNEFNGPGCPSDPTQCGSYKTRADINARLSGGLPITPQLGTVSFAALPTEQDGKLLWCSDCARTNPCTGSGSGAFAYGYRGIWQCMAPGPLEQDLAAGGHKVTGLAALVPNNDRSAMHTLNGFSVGQKLDVTDPYFGAVNSTQTMTCTATSGSASLTGCSTSDSNSSTFATGQHISIFAAGAASTLAAPSGVTALPYTYSLGGNDNLVAQSNSDFGFTSPGCFVDKLSSVLAWSTGLGTVSAYDSGAHTAASEVQFTYNGQTYGAFATTGGTVGGSAPTWSNLFVSPIPVGTYGGAWNPGAYIGDGSAHWVVFGFLTNNTTSNTDCTHTYAYKVAAVDAAGGQGLLSSAATAYNGPAIPSATNRIKVSIPPVTSAPAYAIYRSVNGGAYSLYQVIPAMNGNATNPQVYYDMGNGGWSHYVDADGSPDTAVIGGATQNNYLDTIASTSSGTLTLSTTGILYSGSVMVFHDNAPAINAALALSCGGTTGSPINGRITDLPAGYYPLGQTLNLEGCSNGVLRGHGTGYGYQAGQNSATNLIWEGPVGGLAVNMNHTLGTRIESLALVEDSFITADTIGVGFDIDNYTTVSPVGPAPYASQDRFSHVVMNEATVPIRLADRSTANVEGMLFDDVYVGSSGYHCWHGVDINGGGQTDDERFHNIEFPYGGCDAVFELASHSNVGSVDVNGLFGSGSILGFELNNASNIVKKLSISTHNYAEAFQKALWFGSTANAFPSNIVFQNAYFNPGSAYTASNGFYISAPGGRIDLIDSDFGVAGTAPFKINVGVTIPSYSRASLGMLKTDGSNRYLDPAPFYGVNARITVSDGDCVVSGSTCYSLFGGEFHGQPLIAPGGWQHPTVSVLATPATPTGSATGGSGTNNTYQTICVAGRETNGGFTLPSNTVTISGGATLSSSVYNTINETYEYGCTSWIYLRQNGSNWDRISPVGYSNLSFVDNGSPVVTASYTVPTRNSTQDAVLPVVATTPTTATYSSGGAVSCGSNGIQHVTLSGSGTLTLSLMAPGQVCWVDVAENATGGYTPTWAATSGQTLAWDGAASQPAQGTTASTHYLWKFLSEDGNVIVGHLGG